MTDPNAPDRPSTPDLPIALPPGPSPPPRRTTWPVVFGVGAILFGLLGVMASLPAGCAGGLMAIVMPAGSQDAALQDVQGLTVWIAIFSWLSVGLSIALLIGGIGLCRRRAWSVKLFCVWSVANVLVTAVAGLAIHGLCRKMLGSIQRHSSELMLTLSDSDIATFSLVIAVAVLLIGWSSPIFLMIWFARRPIRDEVAGWT